MSGFIFSRHGASLAAQSSILAFRARHMESGNHRESPVVIDRSLIVLERRAAELKGTLPPRTEAVIQSGLASAREALEEKARKSIALRGSREGYC